jgi:DNA-binding transcriptional MerR regulator
MATTKPKILTSRVAQLIERSADRVRQLEAAGVLRAERTSGGVRLFDVDEVLAFVKARAERAAAEK